MSTRSKAGTAASPGMAGVVFARIHPAIGIARVGNSGEGVFVGPQVREPLPPTGGYRDANGALKRQVAEFRVYGCAADGRVLCELTSANARIDWRVHLANGKAAWYQWKQALDIEEAASDAVGRRNASLIDPASRAALVIDAGPQYISSHGAAGAQAVCARGRFFNTSVLLGQLCLGPLGRLHVLPGHGRSGSPRRRPIYDEHAALGFANADGWYDDIADGPVDARVQVGGRSIPCEPAWVVTAPPNYAPQLKSVTTLYDVMHDAYVQAGWMPGPPARVSFREDVLPILRRLTDLQWVNQGFAAQFGHFGVHNFADPALLARLSRGAGRQKSATDADAALRRQIFDRFRVPGATVAQAGDWPWIYGDADSGSPTNVSPRRFAAITRTQHATLARWARGDFVEDWPGTGAPPRRIEDVDVALQPAMLDRAALEFCLGDVFHPGNELTWPMRHVTIYESPFRIRRRPPGQAAADPGPVLRASDLDGPDSPLRAQGPGDLTRWMAVPWQADTAMCGSGYDGDYDPAVPTYWPAHVPNHVLDPQAYAAIGKAGATPQARADAFAQRSDWSLPIKGPAKVSMARMVKLFGSMGVLEEQRRPTAATNLPRTLLVARCGDELAPAKGRPRARPAAPARKVAPAPKPAARKRRARAASGGGRG